MKFAAVFVTAVLAAEHAEHYAALNSMLEVPAEVLSSPALAELHTHVALQNPMKTIYDTCNQMRVQIRHERTIATKKELVDRKLCRTTLSDYESNIDKNQKNKADKIAEAARLYKTHSALWDEPASLNKTRAARNISIASQEVTVKRGQKARDTAHEEFLKLQAAFETALEQIGVIHRVLNGEGTLSDLGGGSKAGFLEEQSCSSRFHQLVKDTKEVPRVSNMLQVFAESFEKVENAKDHTVAGTVRGAKVSTETKAKANKGNMDAVNALLKKVRENLVKSMQLSYKQETTLINLWKAKKQKMRRKINDDWILNWNNFVKQGEVELSIGQHWVKEGNAKIRAAQYRKRADETTIMNEFLTKRCAKSRRDYASVMSNYANELNALDAVIRYLKVNVFPKWSKDIVDTVSSPYNWKVEKATYIKVSNTYSSTGYNKDPVSCRKSYSTVYSGLRILTQTRTNQKYIDPNDLTKSVNMQFSRKSALKGDVECQQFPSGIPVGTASSCSSSKYVYASIDLTGTGYKFGKAAQRMFVTLGRKSSKSKVEFTDGGRKVAIKTVGRCGQTYPDDSGENADYRADPIPLEKA